MMKRQAFADLMASELDDRLTLTSPEMDLRAI
jgi:hypothetical protein